MVKILYIQLTCNFHQTNTLKYTNRECAVKLNTKKVVFLHKHTLRDVYSLHNSSVALSMMLCSKPCQPYHNVGQLVHVMIFYEAFYANFVVQWVQIWVLEPQT